MSQQDQGVAASANAQAAGDGLRIYTCQELSEVLKVNIRYVRENARTRKWPSLSFGARTIRFTEDHLNQILSLSEVPPPPPQSSRRRTRRPSY